MPRKKKIENDVESEETLDTNKILKDLKKELHDEKDKLVEEMNTSINEQIEFSVNKRMKEEEKKFVRGKNAKIIRRDVLILFLVLLAGYLVYCLYEIDYFHIGVREPNTPIVDKKEDESKNDKSKEYYIDNFGYLVDNMQIEDTSVFEMYNSVLNGTGLTDDLILKIAYKNMADTVKAPNNNLITFTGDKLLSSAKNIFGDKVILNNKPFAYNSIRFLYYNDSYLGEYVEPVDTGFLYKIYDAREENDMLSFDVVVGKVSENKLVSLNDVVILENYNNEDIEPYRGNLNCFRFTFGKKGENYVFYKLENVI